MSKDPYTILNVSRDASDDDIKKAYRSMAKKMHPDVNGGKTTKEFQEVQSAYEQIQKERSSPDPADHFTFNFGNSGFGNAGFDFDPTMFYDLFSRTNGFDARAARGLDIYVDVEVKFEDAYKGTKVPVEYTQKDGRHSHTKKFHILMDMKAKHTAIKTEGFNYYTIFKFRGEGNAMTTGTRSYRGNLIVQVNIRMPNNISMRRYDVIHEKDIKLLDVLAGDKLLLETIDGRKFNVKIKKLTHLNGVKIKIPGLGLKQISNFQGDYIFDCKILMPDISKLSVSDVDKLKAILIKTETE